MASNNGMPFYGKLRSLGEGRGVERARSKEHRRALIAVCAERGNHAVSTMGSLIRDATDDDRSYLPTANGGEHVARLRGLKW